MKVAVGSSREVVIVERWPRLVEVGLYTLTNVRCTRCIIMLQSNTSKPAARVFVSLPASVHFLLHV